MGSTTPGTGTMTAAALPTWSPAVTATPSLNGPAPGPATALTDLPPGV